MRNFRYYVFVNIYDLKEARKLNAMIGNTNSKY